jgi:hypothetical protein
MFYRALICSLSLVALVTSTVQADPKDDVQAAVQKLADSASYSWKTTTEGGFSRGPTTGKTEKAGFTFVSMSMRDTDYQMLLKDGKAVIKMPDNTWKTSAEVIAANPEGGPPDPSVFVARIAPNFKTPSQQAADNLDKLVNLQKTDDGYTADLTEQGAKDMMMGRRPNPSTNPSDAPQIDISNAKASVKLWITDGTISKMQIHVSGTITFNGNDRDVDRTVTTEISDVGTTTITSTDAPDDAKAKLAS